MRRTVLIALVVLAAAPAFGQQQVTPPPGLEDLVPPPRGGVSVSSDGRMLISSDLCASLAAEAAVPGADYRPGVDVNGAAVAPADLPGSAPALTLDNLPIEISAATRKRYAVPATSPFFRGKAVIGLVTVRDGRTYFNGQPISDNERDMMLAACKEAKH